MLRTVVGTYDIGSTPTRMPPGCKWTEGRVERLRSAHAPFVFVFLSFFVFGSYLPDSSSEDEFIVDEDEVPPLGQNFQSLVLTTFC